MSATSSRLRLAVVAAAAGLLGLATGIGVTAPVVMHFAAASAAYGVIDGVTTKVSALSDLRGGQTGEAIARLEGSLDADLVLLRPHMSEHSASRERAREAARAAAAYRAGVVHVPADRQVAAAVDRVFMEAAATLGR